MWISNERNVPLIGNSGLHTYRSCHRIDRDNGHFPTRLEGRKRRKCALLSKLHLLLARIKNTTINSTWWMGFLYYVFLNWYIYVFRTIERYIKYLIRLRDRHPARTRSGEIIIFTQVKHTNETHEIHDSNCMSLEKTILHKLWHRVNASLKNGRKFIRYNISSHVIV